MMTAVMIKKATGRKNVIRLNTTRGLLALLLCLGVLYVVAQPASNLIANRYQVLSNGEEIKDTKTKLIWQRCSVGKTWDGRNCGLSP